MPITTVFGLNSFRAVSWSTHLRLKNSYFGNCILRTLISDLLPTFLSLEFQFKFSLERDGIEMSVLFLQSYYDFDYDTLFICSYYWRTYISSGRSLIQSFSYTTVFLYWIFHCSNRIKVKNVKKNNLKSFILRRL